MKKLIIITLFVVIGMLMGCSDSPHQKINGTWTNAIMTVTIDFEKNIYSGVALGKSFKNKLSLVSENANIVVFKSNNSKITCQIQDDDNIMLTKEGGIPIVLKRFKK